MSSSIKNNRVTIYFSKKRDKELISEMEGIEAGDIGWFVKELMKDGIKYRKGVDNVKVAPIANNYLSLQKDRTSLLNPNIQGATPFEELFDMPVIKKELSNDETEDLFDKL